MPSARRRRRRRRRCPRCQRTCDAVSLRMKSFSRPDAADARGPTVRRSCAIASYAVSVESCASRARRARSTSSRASGSRYALASSCGVSGIFRSARQCAKRMESSSTRDSTLSLALSPVSGRAGDVTAPWSATRSGRGRKFGDVRRKAVPTLRSRTRGCFSCYIMPGIPCSVCMRSGRRRRKIAYPFG